MCNCSKEYELLPEFETLESYNPGFNFRRPATAMMNYEARPSVTLGQPTVTPLKSGGVVKSTPCTTPAISVIPRHLEPKLMGCLNKVVPSIDTRYLFEKTFQANPGPFWVKKLNTDLRTFLTQLYPNVNLTIELWRFATIPQGNMRAALIPLRKYLKRKSGDFTVSIFAPVTSQATVEKISKMSLSSFVSSAGPLTSPNHSYYWHVYVTFPDDVKNNFRNIEWTNADKFEFNKYTLTPLQTDKLKRIAIDIVESWVSTSEKRYNRVVLSGHTDIRGTEQRNQDLGRNRAKAAKEFLEAEIKRVAPAYYLDPTKMNIKYEVISYGETRPISKKPPIVHEFNRRVEIILHGIPIPQATPLQLDDVVIRGLRVINQKKSSINQDYYKRIHCLLTTMRKPQVDDRFISGQPALSVYNSNKFPEKDEWMRVRFILTNQDLFNQNKSDEQIFQSLLSVDQSIKSGIDLIAQKVNTHMGVMYLPLPPAFDRLTKWVSSQGKNKNSILSCY